MLAGCDEPPRDVYLSEPKQSRIPAYNTDDRGLKRVARFEAEVLVLSRKSYDGFLKDDLSDFSPLDLAVAWGDASRAEVQEKVRVRQRRRYYFWSSDAEGWNDERVRRFGEQTANWHIIPADEAIARRLKRVDENDVVAMKGHLVDIEAPNGLRVKTSLSRTDKGGGACEIFLVEDLQVRES